MNKKKHRIKLNNLLYRKWTFKSLDKFDHSYFYAIEDNIAWPRKHTKAKTLGTRNFS